MGTQGSDESRRRDDTNRCVPVGGRDHGIEDKGRQGCRGCIHGVAVEQGKKSGSFKFAGMLNRKLKNKPATKARKGMNPFTKEPCVFKAKPASKTVRCLAMKKLKELL